MRVSSLGYTIISAQDLPAWKAFGATILGLMLDEQKSTSDALFFRMDEHPSRLIIQQGDVDKAAAFGWEFSDKKAYTEAVAALNNAAADVIKGDVVGAAMRNVIEYAISTDVAGNPLEVFHTRTGLNDNFSSPLDIKKFVTGSMGMGHVVLPAPNMDETHGFYKSVLGFKDSDNLTLPPPAEGAPEQNIRFMHAANARHHSLGLYNFPLPSGIVHLMIEVTSIDEVGTCLDRVQAGGYPLLATLGRHCNDNMLSFYVVGPGGIAVEFGCQGRQINWHNFEATTTTVGDFWGHSYAPLSA